MTPGDYVICIDALDTSGRLTLHQRYCVRKAFPAAVALEGLPPNVWLKSRFKISGPPMDSTEYDEVMSANELIAKHEE